MSLLLLGAGPSGSGVGGGGGGSFTAWDPADKATQLGLSNSDRTVAKAPADDGNWRSIRTADPIQDGDAFYFELGYDVLTHLNGFLWGFTTKTANILNSYVGSTAGSVGEQINFGALYGSWTRGGSGNMNVVDDDRAGFAIKRNGGTCKVWWREVTGGSIGDWNGDAVNHDPATATGGHVIGDATLLAAADWYFAASILQSGDTLTLYPTATLLGSAPSGFTAGYPA